MATPLIPLSTAHHRTQGWARPSGCQFAAADTVAPLLLAELPAALAEFPVAFLRQAQRKPQLVAITGLQPRQSLMVDAAGRWLAGYMPACYRAWPFTLNRVSAEDARMALCFNNRDGLLRQQPDAAKGEQRFFDDDGKPTPVTDKLVQFLQTSVTNALQTQAAVDALDAEGLLAPWPGLDGLLRVDETGLAKLDAPQLQALRDANALPLAYAQLLSMARIAKLERLLSLRQQAQAKAGVATATPAPDLSLAAKLFEPGEPDTVKFNW